MITATAVGLALAIWAKGTALQVVSRRLDADFARKFDLGLTHLNSK